MVSSAESCLFDVLCDAELIICQCVRCQFGSVLLAEKCHSVVAVVGVQLVNHVLGNKQLLQGPQSKCRGETVSIIVPYHVLVTK